MNEADSPLNNEKHPPPSRPWMGRLVRWTFLFGVVPYVAIVAALAIFQRHLIFPLTRTERLLAEDQQSPEGCIEDVTYQTADGLTINGWRFRAKNCREGKGILPDEDSRPVILYFPGNGGTRQDRVQDGQEYCSLASDVFLFDYRGYADNPGAPGEQAIVSDAYQAWKFVTRDQGIPPERLLIVGESLGGGVATALTDKLCRDGKGPLGLVVNSTFSSLADTAARQYPWVPVRLLILDPFDSTKRMPNIDCPVVVLHGNRDELVPINLAQKLYAAVPDQSRSGIPKQFIEVKGAGHNQISYSELTGAIRNLLQKIREHAAQ